MLPFVYLSHHVLSQTITKTDSVDNSSYYLYESRINKIIISILSCIYLAVPNQPAMNLYLIRMKVSVN